MLCPSFGVLFVCAINTASIADGISIQHKIHKIALEAFYESAGNA